MENSPSKAATKSSSFINRLAPEIQLRVLSCLPNVAEILKCRRVSSYMRRLIDLEENQVIAAEVIVSDKRCELERVFSLASNYDIDEVDEDGNPCGFLNALVAFNKHRGLSMVFCFDYYMLHRMFIDHWWTKHPECERQDAASLDDASKTIFSAIVAIHSIHIMYHVNKNVKKESLDIWTRSLSDPDTMSAMRLSSPKDVDLIVERVAAGIFLESAPFEETCESFICRHYDAPKDWLVIQGSEELMSLKIAKRHASTLHEPTNEVSDEDATAHTRAIDRANSGRATVKQSTNQFAIFEQDEEAEPEEEEAESEEEEDEIEWGEEEIEISPGAWDFEDEDDGPGTFLSDDALAVEHKVSKWLTYQFEVTFGAPGLPITLPFAYFAKTQWAYDSIVDAVMGLKHLTPLEQAAVLEHVAIY